MTIQIGNASRDAWLLELLRDMRNDAAQRGLLRYESALQEVLLLFEIDNLETGKKHAIPTVQSSPKFCENLRPICLAEWKDRRWH